MVKATESATTAIHILAFRAVDLKEERLVSRNNTDIISRVKFNINSTVSSPLPGEEVKAREGDGHGWLWLLTTTSFLWLSFRGTVVMAVDVWSGNLYHQNNLSSLYLQYT